SDAEITERVAVAPQSHRDTGHRIFDRAADADLVVGRAQRRRIFGAHSGDDLTWAQRKVIFAVAAGLGDQLVLPRIPYIEISQRHGAPAGRSGDIDLGIQD